MRKTGVKATKNEIKQLRRYMNEPVMYLSGGTPMSPDPRKECHRMALAHGLPEIAGFYGITDDGEFFELFGVGLQPHDK